MSTPTKSFILLAPYLVKHHWETIESFLKRADDNTLSIEDIEDSVMSGENTRDFWVYLLDNKITYVVMASLCGKTYFIERVAGGGNHNPWPDMSAPIQERANALDMDTVSFIGKPLWSNKLKDIGFTVTQHYYEFQLKDKVN